MDRRKKPACKTGDTIISVNGKPVKNGDELVADISALKPGATAKIGYVRNGKEASVEVTIADRAKLFANRLGGEQEEGEEGQPQESKFGVTVRGITQDMANRYQSAKYQRRDRAGSEARRLRRYCRPESRRRHPGDQQAAGE